MFNYLLSEGGQRWREFRDDAAQAPRLESCAQVREGILGLLRGSEGDHDDGQDHDQNDARDYQCARHGALASQPTRQPLEGGRVEASTAAINSASAKGKSR